MHVLMTKLSCGWCPQAALHCNIPHSETQNWGKRGYTQLTACRKHNMSHTRKWMKLVECEARWEIETPKPERSADHYHFGEGTMPWFARSLQDWSELLNQSAEAAREGHQEKSRPWRCDEMI